MLGKYDKPEDRWQFSYIYDRMNTFFQSSQSAIEKNTMHHQNKQALIAIGSGWALWLGFGNSVQKYWYLPEPQGDFIFSIITEELWFIGAFWIICIYLAIIYRGFIIASFCEEFFGKLVAFGITVWIFWQLIINISVNLSIFPNTGLTLPFVSYGGSSLLMMLLATGILLSISRTVPADKKNIRTMIQYYLLRKPRR
jgi:cell division protein FtsW